MKKNMPPGATGETMPNYAKLQNATTVLDSCDCDPGDCQGGNATIVAPAIKPVSRPTTPEETDGDFAKATNVQDIYKCMQSRCEQFESSDIKRGNESRKAGAMTPDRDILWQGDVGVVLMSDATYKALQSNLKEITNGGSHVQVAVGEGVGSRHTVSTSEVRVFSRTNAGVLEGPVVVADKPFTLSHPKHQNVEFEAGCYSIHYQRMYAEELRRAAD